MVIHVYLVLIPLLLFLAAIFAASEASLFSLSRTQLESIRQTKPGLYRSIRTLISKPDALLSTMIIGNECLNILIGTFIVALFELHFGQWDEKVLMLASVVTSSLLLLTFSEILPKVLAFRMPMLAASILVYPASWAQWLFTPFRKIFLAVSREVLKLFNIRNTGPAALSEKDLLTLVEVGAESGSLDKDEKEMIYNVFLFSDRPVSSVMTQWKDVFTIPETTALDDIFKAVRKKTFSRIPVVSEDGNQVIGILYTKELLKLLLAANTEAQEDALENAVFPPYIVSSHKKISKLFREFKAKKIHIALVVDEYGRHTGVVTLEDILNALFQTQRKTEEKKA